MPPAKLTGRTVAALFTCVAGVTLLLDLFTKWYVFRTFSRGRPHTVVPGLIDFRLSLNEGAALSLFTGWKTFLVIVSLLACAGILWALVRYGRRSRLLTVSLALLFGGALGNVYDRLFHPGVRDFVDLHVAGWHWPGIFNVADVAIFFACVAIALQSLFGGERDNAKAAKAKRSDRRG